VGTTPCDRPSARYFENTTHILWRLKARSQQTSGKFFLNHSDVDVCGVDDDDAAAAAAAAATVGHTKGNLVGKRRQRLQMFLILLLVQHLNRTHMVRDSKNDDERTTIAPRKRQVIGRR